MQGAPKVGVMYENFWKFWDSTKIKCVKCMGGWGIQPDLIQQLFEDKSVIFQKVRWISVSAFIWDHLWVIWTWDGQVGAQKHVWLDSSPPHTLDYGLMQKNAKINPFLPIKEYSIESCSFRIPTQQIFNSCLIWSFSINLQTPIEQWNFQKLNHH